MHVRNKQQKRFFFNLADFLLKKLPRPKNMFEIKTTKKYYNQFQNECENFVLNNLDVTAADKILNNVDVAKPSEIDQVFAKFFKDGAPVIALHLTNITSLSVKLDALTSKFRIAKIKPLFKKVIQT